MAGAGYKLFATGDVLTAAQVNTYLNEQTVMVFADSAARTTALSGVLAEGMVSYLQDTNAVEVYNGSSWVNVGNAGDITEVQAGVGISVASGTGPIPVITNSSTDLITTAGDLLYGTAADTVARLGIGTAGQVLQVNSGATAPEWAAPAAGGGGKILQVVRDTDATQRSTTSTSFVDVTGVSVTITPTSASSNILLILSANLEASPSDKYAAYQITDSSNVAISGAEVQELGTATIALPGVLMAFASPATTSAVTYKMRFKTFNALTTAYVRGDLSTTQLFALEIGV